MSIADDYGRYDGRPCVLRAMLYPLKLDNVSEPDVAKWLDECSRAALVRGYVVSGEEYVEILGFDQRLRAMRSKWPEPPDTIPPSAVAVSCQRVPAVSVPVHVSVSESESPRKEGTGENQNFSEIPSLKEVKEYGSIHGVPEPSCQSFWSYHTDQNVWQNGHGRMINWRSKLITWGNRDRQNPQTNGKPAVPIWEKRKALEKLVLDHPANRDSLSYNPRCTRADWEQLKELRLKLKALNHEAANA